MSAIVIKNISNHSVIIHIDVTLLVSMLGFFVKLTLKA